MATPRRAGAGGTERALDALTMARCVRRPGAGLVHHTDRGCPYTAATYQATLVAHGVTRSMSRSGECRDNAMAERCFATFKAAVADIRIRPTRAAARLARFAWIAVWWNRQRRHPSLAYQPPVTVEALVWLHDQAA